MDAILSKVAQIPEEGNEKQFLFQYKGKTWQLLESYSNDVHNLLNFIRMSEDGKLKDIAFTESEDCNFLLARYINTGHCRINRANIMAIENLLTILFPNINKRAFLTKSANVEGKELLKDYVTNKLFDELQAMHTSLAESKEGNDCLALPAQFLPKLCRYQEDSVLWLLSKESAPEEIPSVFEKLVAKDGETEVYKHLFSIYMQNTDPPRAMKPPGGILADEMGLGKTVELLALILLNPRVADHNNELSETFKTILSKRRYIETAVFCICTSKSTKKIVQCNKCFLWQHSVCVSNQHSESNDIQSPYICPSCWQEISEEIGLLKSKATVIVSPNTIKLQWLSEIRRHIQPTLRVFLYDGVAAGKWICPTILAGYDVILTDYAVLRGEFYFTSENVSQRMTRNKPRTIRIHSPLLMIEWWRVCLDEAQMVESSTSNVSSLVRMIPAINRWAVTGTPIQRSINDLQPLLHFVGFDVAAETTNWNLLVHEFLTERSGEGDQYKINLIQMLQKCMWRTCKSKVAHELKIPAQKEIVHYIDFSNLEKLFYNEQHAECRANFAGNVYKYTKEMSTISPKVMKIILQPFLKIRQSCAMPVVVSNSHSMSIVTQQRQFLQPQELHDYLKSTNEINCKTELRSMASSHNGLAALNFLLNKYDEVIKHYEAVLKLATEYNDMNITVDSLLQIHAIHNLIMVKKIQKTNQQLTLPLCLERLEDKYNSLEWKYMNTYSTTLASVMAAYTMSLAKENAEATDKIIDSISGAFDSVLGGEDSVLLQKIYEECLPRFGNTNSKVTEIQSIQSLLYVIDIWWTKLESILRKITVEIEDLKYFYENVKPRNHISPDICIRIIALVDSVYNCHLNQTQENKKSKKKTIVSKKTAKCKLCSIREYINTFECLLFDKVIDKTSSFTKGLENPSFEMILCKISFSYLKSKQTEALTIAALEKSYLRLENLQTLCKRLIKLWIEMEYTITAYVELDMCKMRISLTEDPDDKSNFKIFAHEIEERLVDHQNDLSVAERAFVRHLSRLKYINHLKNEEIVACPICQLSEQDRYAVLECGHYICLQCLQSIRLYSKKISFKCSVCRSLQMNQKSKPTEHEETPIKGNYSSKISLIIRLILKLQREDRNTHPSEEQISKKDRHLKILVFSQWMQILSTIGLALKENNITFRLQCTPKTLEDFKNPSLGITCLLMPFVKGSKGLNLVEATHVFLVEPILNPGEELQAIGRVHRFGQKSSTTIHRFIMRDSIEENIYNFIASTSTKNDVSSKKWGFENISLDDFTNLFTLKAHGR